MKKSNVPWEAEFAFNLMLEEVRPKKKVGTTKSAAGLAPGMTTLHEKDEISDVGISRLMKTMKSPGDAEEDPPSDPSGEPVKRGRGRPRKDSVEKPANWFPGKDYHDSAVKAWAKSASGIRKHGNTHVERMAAEAHKHALEDLDANKEHVPGYEKLKELHGSAIAHHTKNAEKEASGTGADEGDISDSDREHHDMFNKMVGYHKNVSDALSKSKDLKGKTYKDKEAEASAHGALATKYGEIAKDLPLKAGEKSGVHDELVGRRNYHAGQSKAAMDALKKSRDFQANPKIAQRILSKGTQAATESLADLIRGIRKIVESA